MLDPSCGTGNFLLGALDWAERTGLPADRLAEIAAGCLYGADLDAKAVSLCRVALAARAGAAIAAVARQRGADRADAFLRDLMQHLRKNIVALDSLLIARAGAGSPFAGLRFDLVFGNPPYLSFGSRDQGQCSSSWQQFVRRQFPQAAEYKLRLHSVFQDLCLDLAGEGGHVILLLPDAFLTGSQYRRLRARLLSRATVESVSELPADTIDGATVGRWCIAHYRRCSPPPDHTVAVRAASEDGQSAARFAVPFAAFVSPDKGRFRLFQSETDLRIALKLEALPRLSSLLRGHTGMRSRVGQKRIIAGARLGESWKPGISSGASVRPYAVDWDGTYLNVDRQLLFAGGFDAAVVEHPKLLVRQTGDRLIAALDRLHLYHLNNVHSFSPTFAADGREALLPYLEALFNSRLWLYLYRQASREGGLALAQIDIETVESLPVPVEASAGCEQVAALAERLKATRKEQQPDPQEVARLEQSLNRLVYDLYDLTEPEVARVESSTCSHRSESLSASAGKECS